MSVTTTTPPAPLLRRDLTAARLPKWAPIGVAVLAIALGCAIGAGAGLASHIQWGLIAAALFLVISYGLSAKVEGRRQAKDRFATSVVWVAFILAVVPLGALTFYTVQQGADAIDGDFLTHSMKGVVASTTADGGIYHAIIGTLEQVLLATLIAAPIGLLTAVYLVEYGRGRLAQAVTFFVDVMTGVPSVVAGLFIFSLWSMFKQGYSGFSGSLALAILMIPVVVRSAEEMLKLVPNELREASYALGVPKWKTIVRIVIPTAIGGITTGVMLAVARITGETAPVLMLVFGSDVINNDPFHDPQQSLPLYIWQQYTVVNNEFGYDRAWGAALVLIAFVMGLNLVARGIARWRSPKAGH